MSGSTKGSIKKGKTPTAGHKRAGMVEKQVKAPKKQKLTKKHLVKPASKWI